MYKTLHPVRYIACLLFPIKIIKALIVTITWMQDEIAHLLKLKLIHSTLRDRAWQIMCIAQFRVFTHLLSFFYTLAGMEWICLYYLNAETKWIWVGNVIRICRAFWFYSNNYEDTKWRFAWYPFHNGRVSNLCFSWNTSTWFFKFQYGSLKFCPSMFCVDVVNVVKPSIGNPLTME